MLRKRGVPETQILAEFDHKYTSAQLTALIEDMRVKNRMAARRYYERNGWWLGGPIVVDPRPDPSTLAEREKRLALWPKTITAFICGDPLPGMSALDRAERA